jgi:hypothetical protein
VWLTPFGSPKLRRSSRLASVTWSRSWATDTPRKQRTSWPLHWNETPAPRWGPSWWDGCPRRETNASVSSLSSIASRLSFSDTSGASPQTCQTTSSAASNPAGYPPTYRPLSPASPRAMWTPRPAVRTASPWSHPNRSSRGLRHSATATHVCSRSRTSPARWQHSAQSGPTFAPASGTSALAVKEPERKSVHSPAPTGSREIKTAGINGDNVCATTAGRLFIADRISKRQFLVDTYSDLCI